MCSWSGQPSRPRTQHDYHHDTKVKPEVATAVTELLMTGWKAPETCWAVNKRQDNKLENCCIWLVIYLNCTIPTNLKSKRAGYNSWWRPEETSNYIPLYWNFIYIKDLHSSFRITLPVINADSMCRNSCQCSVNVSKWKHTLKLRLWIDVLVTCIVNS
jgi:hypothetical protein